MVKPRKTREHETVGHPPQLWNSRAAQPAPKGAAHIPPHDGHARENTGAWKGGPPADLVVAGKMGAPGVNVAYQGLRIFGYLVSFGAMSAAECMAGDPGCSKTDVGIAAVSIFIPEARLTKVLETHTAGGVLSAGKSLFSAGEDVKSLIQAAGSAKETVQAGGNVERVVDAGRAIGTDRSTGLPTSVYTVITDTSGNLVTAFPGKP